MPNVKELVEQCKGEMRKPVSKATIAAVAGIYNSLQQDYSDNYDEFSFMLPWLLSNNCKPEGFALPKNPSYYTNGQYIPKIYTNNHGVIVIGNKSGIMGNFFTALEGTKVKFHEQKVEQKLNNPGLTVVKGIAIRTHEDGSIQVGGITCKIGDSNININGLNITKDKASYNHAVPKGDYTLSIRDVVDITFKKPVSVDAQGNIDIGHGNAIAEIQGTCALYIVGDDPYNRIGISPIKNNVMFRIDGDCDLGSLSLSVVAADVPPAGEQEDASGAAGGYQPSSPEDLMQFSQKAVIGDVVPESD